jgi:hypothetical protein
MFFMALCLLSVGTADAFAQGCFDSCQQTLAACLQTAEGDPQEESRCMANYEKCWSDCMLAREARKEGKTKLKAVTGSFILYAGYSPMEEMLLPFSQRISAMDQLIYQLSLLRSGPTPLFHTGFFRREDLFN